MELVTCPNCCSAYGDLQSECPNCEADHDGDGARLQLDSAARTAVSSLGGVFGGILEGPGSTHVLWCAHGVCLYSDEAGLLWRTELHRRVDEVVVREESIDAIVRGVIWTLGVDDGEVQEPGD